VEKVFDEDVQYKGGSGGIDSLCHLTLYRDGDESLAIFEELPDNPGTSITNAIAQLATTLANSGSIPAVDKMTLVENYGGEYSRISLSWGVKTNRPYIGRQETATICLVGYAPRWRYIDQARVKAMIQTGLENNQESLSGSVQPAAVEKA
jgi:hypothetical protein